MRQLLAPEARVTENPGEARTKSPRGPDDETAAKGLAREHYFLTSEQAESASLPKASSPFIVFKIL
jgi:hypothetical protein